jgi:hypothetical protein
MTAFCLPSLFKARRRARATKRNDEGRAFTFSPDSVARWGGGDGPVGDGTAELAGDDGDEVLKVDGLSPSTFSTDSIPAVSDGVVGRS